MAREHDSEFKVAPGIRIGGDGGILDAREIQKVWLWDIGPEEPRPPVKPDAPKSKDPIALKEAEFEAETWAAQKRQYDADLAAFVEWNRSRGGPYMEPMWSRNAQDALANDARAVDEKRQTRRRWYLSSRTRGYRHLPNEGLPEGMRPGRWHHEMIKRELAGEAEYIAARKADPVFGMEMAS